MAPRVFAAASPPPAQPMQQGHRGPRIVAPRVFATPPQESTPRQRSRTPQRSQPSSPRRRSPRLRRTPRRRSLHSSRRTCLCIRPHRRSTRIRCERFFGWETKTIRVYVMWRALPALWNAAWHSCIMIRADSFDAPASEELPNNVEAVISFGKRGLLAGRERQGTFSSAVLAGETRCDYQSAATRVLAAGAVRRRPVLRGVQELPHVLPIRLGALQHPRHPSARLHAAVVRRSTPFSSRSP